MPVELAMAFLRQFAALAAKMAGILDREPACIKSCSGYQNQINPLTTIEKSTILDRDPRV